MEKLMKVLHNAETGEVIKREFNAEELAKYEADQAVELARLEAEVAKAATRAALLDRLGITEAEAKLLLS
jgi:hypothetical protein